MPAFAHGRTKDLLPPSVARDDKELGDWKNYYVGRFSDRDLMMRYTGLGVGHIGNIPTYIDRTEPALFEELEPASAVVATASSASVPTVLASPAQPEAAPAGPSDAIEYQEKDDDVEMIDGAPDPEEWLPWHAGDSRGDDL